MGFIPEDVIRQVLDRCDIVEIISSYVPLKHAGRNFKASCPFHHEKTPSFVVNPEKQIFHCFGCGVGGNVISFVMSQEHLDFLDAVKSLAARAGVELPALNGKSERSSELRQELRRVHELAAGYFHHNLISEKNPQVEAARLYLKNRGVTLDMAKKFRIGFAMDQWDGLIQYLRKKDTSLDLMEKAGLIVAKPGKEGYYDRFRNRIMFPIVDVNGKGLAFGARTLEADNPAKYINSPETVLYTKGDHLYGFPLSKAAVSQQDFVIVVEGYMDFIMPFEAGVQNIVASLGTALTVNQIRLIRRFTKNIVMLFDSDPAGQNAMIRSLDILVEEGMNVRIAALTSQDDPDSYIRKYGKDKFQKCVENADSLFDFKLKFLMGRYGIKTVENRARISGEMLQTIEKFKNRIIQSEYLKQLATRLAVSPDALMAEMKKISGENPPRSPSKDVTTTREREFGLLRSVERDLLGLMLIEKEFIPEIRSQVDLADFQNQHMRAIVTKIYELFDQGRDVSLPVVMSSLPDQKILQFLSSLLAHEDFLVGDKKRIHRDCIERLKQDRLRLQRRDILRQMEHARDEGNHRELDKLTKEFNLLIKGSKE